MPSFAENRGQLSAASVMLYIGGIPPVRKTDPNFRPQVSNYGLYDTFYTMSSVAQLSDCDRVNTAVGDSGMEGRLIPWAGGVGEVVTICNGTLRVSWGNEVMLIRNGQPGPARTLLGVLSLDSNVCAVDVLSYGARVDLKWGDVLVVKSVRHKFHTASSSSPAPAQLLDVHENWAVFVCVPEFHAAGSAPYNALQIPGVCRQIRERVESFLTLWDASWDAALDRVVFTRNGPRQRVYVAQKFDLLEQHTGGVKLIDDGEDDIVEFSSMAVADVGGDDTPPPATKRSLEEGGDDRADCKRAKH
jgi:hypothetical protein